MFVSVLCGCTMCMRCWSDLRNLRIDAESIRFSDAWKIDIALVYDKTAKVNVQKAHFCTLTHGIPKKYRTQQTYAHAEVETKREWKIKYEKNSLCLYFEGGSNTVKHRQLLVNKQRQKKRYEKDALNRTKKIVFQKRRRNRKTTDKHRPIADS